MKRSAVKKWGALFSSQGKEDLRYGCYAIDKQTFINILLRIKNPKYNGYKLKCMHEMRQN